MQLKLLINVTTLFTRKQTVW